MARWSSQTTHTDISDFSDNPHLKRELKIWRLKIAAVVLTVLAIIGFSAKPAYQAFRESRINKNLEAAKEAARLEDWGTARDRARSVLLARDNDFEAYRIWTRALGKMGEPRTYMAAATLFADERATRDDRLEALQVMSWQAPQSVALSAYASLPDELRNREEFRAAVTPLLCLRGQAALAESGLREVMGERPSPSVRLELVRVICALPDAGRVAEARLHLAELISSGAELEALDALLLLGETPGGLASGAPLPDLCQWLSGVARATTLHHLVALHPEIDASPEEADSLFQEAIDRFVTTDPGVLGTWLIRHGRAEQAVALLEEPARSRSDAYIARLHALLRQGMDQELAEALQAPPDSADMVEIEIIRAVMAWRGKDPAAAAAAWTRALNHAAFDGSRNRFIEIAKAAESRGAGDAADDAWVGAIRSGWGRLPLYRDLLPVFGSLALKSRSEDLLAGYRSLFRLEPLNPEIANNYHYLALIHGVEPAEVAVTELAKLVASHPEMPEFNSALAMAEMMAGRNKEALSRLSELQASRRVSPMMKKALQGSAMVLNGDTEAGAALLGEVNWKLFMRQERVAFRELLVKLKISGLPMPELELPEVVEDPATAPAWRSAVEKMEQVRSGDVLPALPPVKMPGEGPDSPEDPDGAE